MRHAQQGARAAQGQPAALHVALRGQASAWAPEGRRSGRRRRAPPAAAPTSGMLGSAALACAASCASRSLMRSPRCAQAEAEAILRGVGQGTCGQGWWPRRWASAQWGRLAPSGRFAKREAREAAACAYLTSWPFGAFGAPHLRLQRAILQHQLQHQPCLPGCRPPRSPPAAKPHGALQQH
jgi:hypothetical protein